MEVETLDSGHAGWFAEVNTVGPGPAEIQIGPDRKNIQIRTKPLGSDLGPEQIKAK